LIEALNNSGVAKNKAGIRLYNQKYYPVRYDADNQTLYLKKVQYILFRKVEEHLLPKRNNFTSSELSIQP
jgi:hypothetical protein